MTRLRSEIAQAAARLMCEEQVTDWRLAKHKAAERLGVTARAAMPDNAEVHEALLDYQRLFGGEAYRAHLAALRRTAVQAMELLAAFDPRLVGGTVSGAVTLAHRVQLHAFPDRAESLDIFLHDRRIAFEPDERSYRFRDGREQRVPLCTFEAAGIGVDVALFGPEEQHRAPVNPADGKPYRRLDLEAARRLAADG